MTNPDESFEIHQTHLAQLPGDPQDIKNDTLRGIGEGYAVFAFHQEPTGRIHYEEYLVFPKLGCLKHHDRRSGLSSVPLAYNTKLDGIAQKVLDENWNEKTSPDGSNIAPGIRLKKVSEDQLKRLWQNHRCDDAVREIAATTTVKKLSDYLRFYIDAYDAVVSSKD